MARMSQAVLSAFKLVGSEDACYFCGAPKKGYDTTPHRSVMNSAPQSMERVRVAVCTSCAQRIHYANMVLEHSEKREGAPLGMMSFEAKARLCEGGKWSRPNQAQRPKFVMHDGMVIPSSTTVDGESVYVGGVPWTWPELMALQGPMALKMVGVKPELVAECFWSLVVADEATKVIQTDKAMALLEI